MIAKRVDRRRSSFNLKLLGHPLILSPLHLRLIIVLAALTPLVTHIAICNLLVCQLADARFLLLCVHLALESSHLLADVQCLVHLRRHNVVILLLSFTLFQSRTVLILLELLVFTILNSSIGLIHITLRLLHHLHLGKASLVLPLPKLRGHHLPLRLLHFRVHPGGGFMLSLENGGPLIIVSFPVLWVVFLRVGTIRWHHLFLLGLGRIFDAIRSEFKRVKL